MPYGLGIDVGTTFTAAAISRDGLVETFSLGTYEVAVPSVIFVDGDEMLFGLPAARRGATQPDGLAREFKRRIGDPVPLMLGGSPYHADRLTALMARWVVETVSEQTGDAPAASTMTHPVHWTGYQVGTLATALNEAGLDAGLMTEPAAAAVDYAATTNLAERRAAADLRPGRRDVRRRRARSPRERVPSRDRAVRDRPPRRDRLRRGPLPPRHAPAPTRASAGGPDDAGGTRGAGQDPSGLRRCQGRPVLRSGRRHPGDARRLQRDRRVTRPEFETMVRPMIEQTLGGVDEILRRGSLEPVRPRRRAPDRRVVPDPAGAGAGRRSPRGAGAHRRPSQAGRRQGCGAPRGRRWAVGRVVTPSAVGDETGGPTVVEVVPA